MSAALDVLVVVAARVPTESLLALATGSDAAHAPVWAFEVTGDVMSAGEPGGRMSVRKITDNGGLLSEADCKLSPAARPADVQSRSHAREDHRRNRSQCEKTQPRMSRNRKSSAIEPRMTHATRLKSRFLGMELIFRLISRNSLRSSVFAMLLH